MEYIKNKHGNRIGVVVARILSNKKIGIGWSKVNTKAGDRFNKNIGWSIAYNRCGDPACPPYSTNSCIPSKVKKVCDKMVERSQKYFKQAIADPVEKKKYTIVYAEGGSHSRPYPCWQKVETNNIKSLVESYNYSGSTCLVFEGWLTKVETNNIQATENRLKD